MCPPGTDQTCRGSQRWNILAPLLKEKEHLTDGSRQDYRHQTSPKDFLLDGHTWGSFEKLTHHHVDDINIGSSLPELSSRCCSNYTSPLESLPSELLNLVVSDSCLEPIDVIALGSCSQTLWLHVIRHIHQTHRGASWANTPLICTGTYLTDLPSTIHSICPDMALREKEFFERPGRGGRYAPSRGMCPARKWNWSAIRNYKDFSEANGKAKWTKAFEAVQERSGIRAKEQLELRNSLEVALYPQTRGMGWVLRNHTTHEYVTLKSGGSSGDRGDDLYVGGMSWLTLDKAMMFRICWSPALGPEESTEKRKIMGGVVRGKWAGHSFDVVPEMEINCEEWRDGTGEIVKEAEMFQRYVSNH